MPLRFKKPTKWVGYYPAYPLLGLIIQILWLIEQMLAEPLLYARYCKHKNED